MAKRLLLSILVDSLGQYVEGLKEENLKLGVWSGKVELSNLALKKSALRDLNLPITVRHGVLKLLSLSVPWTSLDSKPVQVQIDGLLLQAEPRDVDMVTMDKDAIRRSIENARRRILESCEKAFEKALAEKLQSEDDAASEQEQQTYVQRLASKIIDNLEINVTNLHVRYEDAHTLPGVIFAMGGTLHNLKVRLIRNVITYMHTCMHACMHTP